MENLTYEEFIQNILDTRGRFNCGDEYHERHHIVPKCLGGTNDKENLIDLYAKEHFIAHKLLMDENPDNDKLVFAWCCMVFAENDYEYRHQLSPDEYENARKIYSETLKDKLVGENNPMFGKRHSKETRNKISEALKGKYTGENNPWYGKHPSEETRKKMSKSQSKRFENQSEKEKMSIALKGKLSGENHPLYGKHHSEETKQKISEALKELFSNPENHPMYGKHHSEETKNKISKNHANVSGENNPAAKPVVCIETMIIYKTATIASEMTHTNSKSIYNCCSGRSKTANGCRWCYLYDQIRKDGVTIYGAITLGLITEEEALRQLNIST